MSNVESVSTPMEVDPGVSETEEASTHEAATSTEPSIESVEQESAPQESAPTETEGLEIQEKAADFLSQAGLDMSALSQEYGEAGQLSEASLKKLDDAGFPKDLVDTYIQGVQAINQQTEQYVQNTVYDSVGGQEKYNVMTNWAASNFSQAEVQAFNDAVNSMDSAKASLAVAGLASRYQNAVGSEGQTVQGTGGHASSGGIYETRAEMLSDLQSPEYNSSPSHRAQIEAKVARSMERHGGSIPS